MYSTVTIGHSLAKRLVEDPPKMKLPDFPILLFLGDFILFFPVLVILGYTLQHVYPTLAAVEDPLPAYEAVPMNDDGTPKSDNDPIRAGPGQPGRPITSSLRATHRLLRSTGSWRANFRGIGYSILVGIATATSMGFFSLAPFIPVRIAHLLALLLVAPLSAAWVHVVITAPSPTKSLRDRIRPLRKVYVATWFPTFLLWAAAHASVVFPTLLTRAIGLSEKLRRTDPDGQIPLEGSDIAKIVCIAGFSIALQALLVIPAHAALTRVNASLLPADEDTLVPFDRSFAGRVEPEVVSGKGFATFGAAIKTIPFSSWVRLYLLRIKIFFVTMATYAVIMGVVAVQMVLVSRIGGGKGADGQ